MNTRRMADSIASLPSDAQSIPTICCDSSTKEVAASLKQQGVTAVRYYTTEKEVPNQDKIDALLEGLKTCSISTIVLHELTLLTAVFTSLHTVMPDVKCLVLMQKEQEKVCLPSEFAELQDLLRPLSNLVKLVMWLNDPKFNGEFVRPGEEEPKEQQSYWKMVGGVTACLPQLKDLEILSYGQFGSENNVGVVPPTTLTPMLKLERLSLAQYNKHVENASFEDGRAAKMDFSACVVGLPLDGEYTGNDIPKDLIDYGLIAKLFPNLSHLELKISRATLGMYEGSSFTKLACLRLVGGNIQKATKITDAVKMCPNLQALDLKGSFIPQDEISSLARSCLQIEMLDLSFVGFNCNIFPALEIVAENIPQLKVLIILGSVYPLSNHDDEFDNIKTNNSSLAPKYGALALLKKFSCLKSFLGADEQWMGVDGYLETSLSFVGVGLTMIATMQSFPAQYSTSVEHRTYKRDQKGEWIPISSMVGEI